MTEQRVLRIRMINELYWTIETQEINKQNGQGNVDVSDQINALK